MILTKLKQFKNIVLRMNNLFDILFSARCEMLAIILIQMSQQLLKYRLFPRLKELFLSHNRNTTSRLFAFMTTKICLNQFLMKKFSMPKFCGNELRGDSFWIKKSHELESRHYILEGIFIFLALILAFILTFKDRK